VGREPDYPALFGELYRRSAGQHDPIWETPPPVEPLPETGPAEPVTGSWPFEETTQSWEPSDRSFIWPSDELPSAPAEWEQPGPAPWEEPDPRPPARPDPPDPRLDQATAWSAPPPAPVGPPPDDWAAAIPTDVPAARRAADPGSATRMWRTDDPADAEPGVPLGPGAAAPPVGGAAARTSRLRGSPGPGAGVTGPRTAQDPAAGAARTRPARRADAPARGVGAWDAEATTGYDTGAAPADEPGDILRKGSPRQRPAGERQAKAWPRIIAIVAWIVLLMVFCWYYVFPWLERVLPESF
jgi:hypothetical protein